MRLRRRRFKTPIFAQVMLYIKKLLLIKIISTFIVINFLFVNTASLSSTLRPPLGKIEPERVQNVAFEVFLSLTDTKLIEDEAKAYLDGRRKEKGNVLIVKHTTTREGKPTIEFEVMPATEIPEHAITRYPVVIDKWYEVYRLKPGKRIDEYPYFKYVLVSIAINEFDITNLDPNNPNDEERIISLRRHIEKSYQESMKAIRYNPSVAIKEIPFTTPSGMEVNIGWIPKKPDRVKGEDVMRDYIIYKGTRYRFGFKGRPYGKFHIVFGTLEKPQDTPLTPEIMEIGLLMARVLGEGKYLFYNRTGPSTKEIFHYQAIESKISIWDQRDKWPVFTRLKTGEDFRKLALEISEDIGFFEGMGAKCDLLFKFDGKEYSALLVPRKMNRASNEFQDEKWFGSFGVLEMGGYVVCCKTKEGLDFIIGKNNGEAYEKALRELSLTVTKLSDLKATPILFRDTDIVKNNFGFQQALKQLKSNEDNIPLVVLTNMTERDVRVALADIDLRGFQFRTLSELGLEGFDLTLAMSLILDIDSLLPCIPLTDSLCEIYEALKKVRDEKSKPYLNIFSRNQL